MWKQKAKVLFNLITERPILVIFDVTKRCNQNCPMCNIKRQHSCDMSLLEIEECVKRLSSFGVGYVFLQGGEPLLRSDILAIIDLFLSYGIRPTVITNGILLRRELAAEIGQRPCNLAVSIDSMNPETYKYMRGADTLERVKNNIINASDLPHKGNWSITTTVSKLSSLSDVQAICDFAYANNFMYAIRPYIHVRGTAGKKEEKMLYEYQDVLSIFEFMLSKARRDNFLASLIYEEHINYMQGKKMPECDALKYSFLLKETGKIAPCIEFPDLTVDLADFLAMKREYRKKLAACNASTPCFYNDAREIGFLWRKKWRILANFSRLVKQMKRYGNFF